MKDAGDLQASYQTHTCLLSLQRRAVIIFKAAARGFMIKEVRPALCGGGSRRGQQGVGSTWGSQSCVPKQPVAPHGTGDRSRPCFCKSEALKSRRGTGLAGAARWPRRGSRFPWEGTGRRGGEHSGRLFRAGRALRVPGRAEGQKGPSWDSSQHWSVSRLCHVPSAAAHGFLDTGSPQGSHSK